MNGMESQIRLGSFLGILCVMMLWETLAPRRRRVSTRRMRWPANFGVLLLGSIPMQWLFPVLATGMAALAHEQGWGLLNNYPVPYAWRVVISVIVLDGVIYFQHLMFHHVPLLWRLHKMHHTDRDIDATSAIRFHPIEIWLSMGIKLAAVAVLGPPVLGVVVFEVLLNGVALFNHGNVRIPIPLDRILRLVVVTPDMHRVHHSVAVRETDSNFGFNLPWWDRIFGTYRAQPGSGHDGMTIGLSEHQGNENQNLWWLLMVPFRKRTPSEAAE